MKTKSLSIRTILLLNSIIFILSAFSPVAFAQADISKNDSANQNIISEEKFILINGIEQWVTIKGDKTKPVILFLHGGPGSPISHYENVMYNDLETDFIIVQWDQRGAGKTYGRIAPEELTPEYLKENPLMLHLMINDGIALSEYLLKKLGKQKIILFGTSWGSVLGVKMASLRPELFYAYVGHSQIVHPVLDGDFYNKIFKMAEFQNDTEALEILNAIGKPPYDRANKAGKLLRIVKKYERANSTPPPNTWFQLSPSYNNATDNQNRSDGDDYSFVNYMGDVNLGVPAMSAEINLMKDNLEFKIPVYLIQGEEDILTPKDKTKEYFDKLIAPEKKYYTIPNASHGFNFAVVEMQKQIFKSIINL